MIGDERGLARPPRPHMLNIDSTKVEDREVRITRRCTPIRPRVMIGCRPRSASSKSKPSASIRSIAAGEYGINIPRGESLPKSICPIPTARRPHRCRMYSQLRHRVGSPWVERFQ